MEIQETPRPDGITQIALVGKMDARGFHAIDMKFHGYTTGRRKNAIVDCSKLEFVASLGIGLIVSCAQALGKHGARLVVVNPQPAIDEVFRLVGADQIIPIVKTIPEAEAIFKA